MPTLRHSPPTPVDTVAPGLARRRVWQAPAVRSHALACLTFARLYLAPANAAIRPDTPGAILNGGDLDTAFGPLATVIDLPTVRRLELDLATNSLTIDYKPQTATRSGTVPPGQVVMEFGSYEAADEVFTKLWRRLADRLTLHQDRKPTRELVRAPLAAIAGVFLATLLVVGVLLATEGHTAVPDWRIAAGLGGATLAGLQVWLYRRWTTPPGKLELLPT